MNIKMLRNFLSELQAELVDEIPGAVSLRMQYRHKDQWFEGNTQALLCSIQSARAEKIKSTSVLRFKGETACNFYIKEFDAIICIVLSFSPKKAKQTKFNKSVQRIKDSFQAKYKSTHDRLTGLKNQGEFETSLKQVIEVSPEFDNSVSEGLDSASKQNEVALLAFDIDHFKSINDRFGHPYGDAVLAAFSWRLDSVCAKYEDSLRGKASIVPYRLGGEEFSVLLHGKFSAIEAVRLAELICEGIRGTDLPDEHEYQVLKADGSVSISEMPHVTERKVTVSCGVAVSSQVDNARVGTQASRLKKKSDIALYSAKASGRDRVRYFDDILKAHGRVVEVHSKTGLVAIDIGADIGVKKGQEFWVIPPDFDGSTPFFSGDGRSRKRLGHYPRYRIGRILVFDVQRDVSFCRVTYRFEGIREFEVGSTIEAIPLGSVAHLLSSEFGETSDGFEKIDGLQSYLNDSKSNPVAVISCSVKNFDTLTSDKGIAFANQVLASLVQEVYKVFSSHVRIAQTEPGSMLILLTEANGFEEFSNVVTSLRTINSSLVERIGQIGGAVFGVWAPNNEHDNQLEFSPIENKANSLEFSIAASTVAAATETDVIRFNIEVASSLLWVARRDKKYDRGIADFERYETLKIETPNMLNQIGLIYLEKPSPSLEAAEGYLRRANLYSDVSAVIMANLALVLYKRESYNESLDVFKRIISIGKDIPDNYEAAYLLTINRSSLYDLNSIKSLNIELIERIRDARGTQVGIGVEDEAELERLLDKN